MAVVKFAEKLGACEYKSIVQWFDETLKRAFIEGKCVCTAERGSTNYFEVVVANKDNVEFVKATIRRIKASKAASRTSNKLFFYGTDKQQQAFEASGARQAIIDFDEFSTDPAILRLRNLFTK